MFLKNYWYVAANANEIDRKPMARTLLGEPVVMYRLENGTPVALEDRCVHRHLPLSMGKLVGDVIQCHYHGLQYDCTGQCTKVPGQDMVPPNAKIKSYPVVERYKWIWIWMGDPAKADPAGITDFHWFDDPAWGAGQSYLHVKANWQLIVDNLLDLTHETYIHRDSLGNQAVVEHPIEVVHDDDSVTVQRFMFNHEPAPFWKAMLNKKLGRDVPADRWQIIHFRPPANLVLDVGVAPTGAGVREGHRSSGVEGCNLNAITPETEHSTWYFWAFARKFVRDDAALTQKLADTVAGIFEQDRVAIEAVHETMLRNRGRPVIHLQTDKGQNIARRLVERRVAAESSPDASR